MANPIPTDIKCLQKHRKLLVTFDNGEQCELTCEFLRVHSPSAEVQGHGGQGGEIPTGKKNVNIIGIEPVGNYAVKLIFDDGHRSGIYTWETLYDLSLHQEQYWQMYLDQLAEAGGDREPQ